MSLNRDAAVRDNHFAGLSNVSSRDESGLAAALRGILIEAAKDRIGKQNTINLVDNSGGTAGVVATFDFTGGAFEDLVTVSGGIDMQTGEGPFRLIESGGLPTGLDDSTDYYCIRKSATTMQLASSKLNALAGTRVEFTSDGTPTNYIGYVAARPALDASVDTGETTGATSATVNESLDDVLVSCATLAERANIVLGVIGAGSVNDGPETGGSGTIGAHDVDVAGNSDDTDCASYDSVQAAMQDVDDAIATIAAVINVCRKAVGLNPVCVASGHAGTIEAGLDINGGSAIENAEDVDPPVGAPTEVAIEAILDWYVNDIAFLATQLDAVTDCDVVKVTTLTFYINPTIVASGADVALGCPVSGRIRRWYAQVTDGAVGTADSVVTIEVNGTAVTGASITLPTAGSAVGDVVADAIDNVGTDTVRPGDNIAVQTDGAGDTAGHRIVLEIEQGADANAENLPNYAG